MNKVTLDLTNWNVKLIIAGLAGLVEDDGMTMREAFEAVEEIKRQTWSALLQMENEKKQ